MKLYNTLTKKIEEFDPINPPHVGIYTCGMTVYDYSHIGHGRKYVGDDILKRVLMLNGYDVKHVQNVTDVGHLVSDEDEGEDKLEKGARKHGKSVWEVAEFFTDHFYQSMDKLNVLRPDVISKATEHIDEQIKMVTRLVEKGYAYETSEAVYFDVSKFKNYGKLLRQKLEEKKTAVREEVKEREEKKNPHDFALWIKRVGEHANHTMHWDSPWGDGFPGWHIECSAMSVKYLGEQFDIHTGGEDHIPVHHPNEIAQSEAVTGKQPFVKYWVHHAFLKVEGRKMSKSLENIFTIEDIEKKGYDPLALRYLYLTAHYRDPLNFTWEALDSAQNAINNLRRQLSVMKTNTSRTTLSEEKRKKVEGYQEKFIKHLNNDLAVPQALATLWEVLKSNIPSEDKYDLALYFDEVLGLELRKAVSTQTEEISQEIKALLNEREVLRGENKFEEADEVRQKIEESGYEVLDTPQGSKLQKK